jgi:hypothetical protein
MEVLRKKGALKGKAVQRVVFNAITKSSVLEAMQHPRDVDTASSRIVPHAGRPHLLCRIDPLDLAPHVDGRVGRVGRKGGHRDDSGGPLAGADSIMFIGGMTP